MIEHFEADLEFVFHKTSSYWEPVRGKTIFITGGTGFFGIWLLMSFIYINKKLSLNSKVILLTRRRENFLIKHPWILQYSEVKLLEGDISGFEFIEDDVHYVVHAATDANIKTNGDEPIKMFDTIVNGTNRALEFARIKQVTSFLLTSSGAVYGQQPSEITHTSEGYVGAPLTSKVSSVYGEGKRMAEVLSAIYFNNYQIPVKIARCYAFLGPLLPLDGHFAAGNFINDVLNNRNVVIQGDGTPMRSYMYPSDMTIWLWTILFKGENNSPYNVGSDQEISISDLAQAILKEGANGHLSVKCLIPKAKTSPLRYIPNIEKASRELNLRVYTDLPTSIKKTLQFLKTKKYFGGINN